MERERRWTTPDYRYQVVGGWAADTADGELIDTFPTKAAAADCARNYIGTKHYAWTQVYDTMHHQDKPAIVAEFGQAQA